jgi:hypothetical protein
VEATDGTQVGVEGRPWSFAQEQAFQAQAEDQVSLQGFYEDGEFKAGRIDNLTNGQSVDLREDSGRPMWAGRGRGRNR